MFHIVLPKMETHYAYNKCYSLHGVAIRSRHPTLWKTKITCMRCSPLTQSLQEEKLRESFFSSELLPSQKRTRLHMVLSIIHYSSQSHRYVFKKLTKSCTVLLLWLVWLLSRCPSCVLLTFRLVAAVGMRHDGHNAGGASCNLEFRVSREHADATLPSRARGTLATTALPKRGLISGLGSQNVARVEGK